MQSESDCENSQADNVLQYNPVIVVWEAFQAVKPHKWHKTPSLSMWYILSRLLGVLRIRSYLLRLDKCPCEMFD